MKKYKNAVVLGLGVSGEGAARLLLGEGARVTVLDRQEAPAVFERAHDLEQDGARVVLGDALLPDDPCDVCIVSPGISPDSAWVLGARERGIEILPELELAWSRCRGPVLAITGSNGKSTAVKWCAEALRRAGRNPVVAGNYGPAFSELVRMRPAADPWVLEVSSFQLETIRDFRPDIGVMLNLYPNHLDRHGTMDAYAGAKAKLFSHTRGADICICHHDHIGQMKDLSQGEGIWWSFDSSARSDYTYARGRIFHHGIVIAWLDGTIFANEIMGPTAAAVLAALKPLGVRPETAVAALRDMEPLPHRMQKVAKEGGIAFVNDSKATNLAAMQAALRMTPGGVRLIAGGLAKEKDFGTAKEVLAERTRSVYLIGTATKDMASAWSGTVPCYPCETLDAAVKRAWEDAEPGDTILLSPACASFDQFGSYEERGRRFAELVRDLVEEVRK